MLLALALAAAQAPLERTGVAAHRERIAAQRAAPPDPDPLPTRRTPAAPAWRSRLELAGLQVELSVEDPGLATRLRPLPAHLLAPAPSGPQPTRLSLLGDAGEWQIQRDGQPCRPIDAGPVANVIHQLVDLACRYREQLVVLHGAGVAKDGRGVLLIGATGSGKSTLTAALNAAGAELLSDDVVPVTLAGELLGVGMSLCLKPGSWPVLGELLDGREMLTANPRGSQHVKFLPPRGPVAREPSRAALFLFPRYAPDGEAAVEALDEVGVLQRMIEAESLVLDLDQDRLEKLARWVGSAPGYALRYPDLETGLAQVQDLMARHIPPDTPS